MRDSRWGQRSVHFEHTNEDRREYPFEEVFQLRFKSEFFLGLRGRRLCHGRELRVGVKEVSGLAIH